MSTQTPPPRRNQQHAAHVRHARRESKATYQRNEQRWRKCTRNEDCLGKPTKSNDETRARARHHTAPPYSPSGRTTKATKSSGRWTLTQPSRGKGGGSARARARTNQRGKQQMHSTAEQSRRVDSARTRAIDRRGTGGRSTTPAKGAFAANRCRPSGHATRDSRRPTLARVTNTMKRTQWPLPRVSGRRTEGTRPLTQNTKKSGTKNGEGGVRPAAGNSEALPPVVTPRHGRQ